MADFKLQNKLWATGSQNLWKLNNWFLEASVSWLLKRWANYRDRENEECLIRME